MNDEILKLKAEVYDLLDTRDGLLQRMELVENEIKQRRVRIAELSKGNKE